MEQHSFNKIQDGDFTVAYSNTFNVFSGKLTLADVCGFELNLEFLKNKKEIKEYHLKGDSDNKVITLEFTNWDSPFGDGLYEPILLFELEDGQKIYLSIFSRSLNEKIDFLQVTLTFYTK